MANVIPANPALEEQVARLSAELAELRAEFTALRDGLAGEVRTRRLVVEDDAGVEWLATRHLADAFGLYVGRAADRYEPGSVRTKAAVIGLEAISTADETEEQGASVYVCAAGNVQASLGVDQVTNDRGVMKCASSIYLTDEVINSGEVNGQRSSLQLSPADGIRRSWPAPVALEAFVGGAGDDVMQTIRDLLDEMERRHWAAGMMTDDPEDDLGGDAACCDVVELRRARPATKVSRHEGLTPTGDDWGSWEVADSVAVKVVGEVDVAQVDEELIDSDGGGVTVFE